MRTRAGLSIYSILLIMLLSVSVLSSIVVGIIGYVNGTEALRAIAYEKLVEIRENRAREVTQLFATIENAVRLGRDERDEQAGRGRVRRGIRGARSAAGGCRSIGRARRIYYRDTFAADLSEATGEEVDGATLRAARRRRSSTCRTST